MPLSNLSEEMKTAKEAAVKAGTEIARIYQEYINNSREINITKKSDNSPLTEADIKANNIIIRLLKESFPQYSILSEESEDDLSRLENKYCWIIDPIDGTKGFVNKNGAFTVNIALSYEHRVILGVIYVPISEEIYYATKNNGAYYEKHSNIQKINASNRTENLRMLMSSSTTNKCLESLIEKYNITDIRKLGSSLKGCLIARGEAEIYYRYGHTMEWDTAAMQCIIEESGAILMQMDDSEMFYNRADSLNSKGFYVINRKENKMIP